MKIGSIDFYDKIKLLSFAEFKKYWDGGNFEKKTGHNVVKAAKKFGIKVPEKKKAKEGDE